jgi:hypothetical protein
MARDEKITAEELQGRVAEAFNTFSERVNMDVEAVRAEFNQKTGDLSADLARLRRNLALLEQMLETHTHLTDKEVHVPAYVASTRYE